MIITQDYLRERMVPAVPHGRYFATVCPFHDSHASNPSFLVYPDGAICLSASCPHYNRRVSLEQVAQRIGAAISVDIIDRRSPQPHLWLEPEYLSERAHEILLRDPSQAVYLRQRGVEKCLLPQHLGWWEGWYTIPIYTADRRFSGLVFRAGPSLAAFTGRYTTPPGQPPLLYVPHWPTILKAKELFIVFGIFDALTLAALGLPVATCTVLRGLKPEMLAAFRKPIWVVPDRGEEAQAHRLVSDLDWRGHFLGLKYPPGYKDPADYAAGRQTDKLIKGLRH